MTKPFVEAVVLIPVTKTNHELAERVRIETQKILNRHLRGTGMKTVRQPKGSNHYRLVCKNEDCAAAMECTKADLRFEADQRDGNSYVLVCPHCQTETWFDIKALGKYAVKPS